MIGPLVWPHPSVIFWTFLMRWAPPLDRHKQTVKNNCKKFYFLAKFKKKFCWFRTVYSFIFRGTALVIDLTKWKMAWGWWRRFTISYRRIPMRWGINLFSCEVSSMLFLLVHLLARIPTRRFDHCDTASRGGMVGGHAERFNRVVSDSVRGGMYSYWFVFFHFFSPRFFLCWGSNVVWLIHSCFAFLHSESSAERSCRTRSASRTS